MLSIHTSLKERPVLLKVPGAVFRPRGLDFRKDTRMRLSYANVANKGSMTQALTRVLPSQGTECLESLCIALAALCSRTTRRVPNTSDEVLRTDH